MQDGTHSLQQQHGQWLLRGTQMHAAGKPEQALTAFETALALAPGDVNTAAACATLLSELNRPQAAYRTLLAFEATLKDNADGAANLAIAAEACGDLAKAQACYAHALALDPDHLRSLNNVGILAASTGQWDIAAKLARRCLDLAPQHAPYHANLCEYLSGAQRYEEALEAAEAAIAQFPDSLELKSRHITLLAFKGYFEKSDATLSQLKAEDRDAFAEFALRLQPPEERHAHRVRTRNIPQKPLDALDLFLGQAFRRLSVCDWRDNTALTGILREALARTSGTAGHRRWHQALFYAPMLDLRSSELQQMQRESVAADIAGASGLLPPFAASPKAVVRKDGLIHVGIAVESLRDGGQRTALLHQLTHHDTRQFAIHVYAFTPSPEAQHANQLRSHAASVAELAHMSDVEAVARIRLDRLDVYVEVSFEAPFQRSLISALRVAPIQIQQTTAQCRSMPCWDYVVSDGFVDTGPPDTAAHGALVRLPHTSWLAAGAGGRAAEDGADGLPHDALIFCALMPPAGIDPQSFSAWMKIMRALPDAVLWLPRCARGAVNLVREANAAGVGADRLLFSTLSGSGRNLARLPPAMLGLDTFRTSSACALNDALQAGIPVITCAGDSAASRMGGSIVRAAGIAECVVPDAEAYVREAVRLGRDTLAVAQLRERLLAARTTAPLFDTASRVSNRESAWTTMVQRLQAGLPPAAFDVPALPETPKTDAR